VTAATAVERTRQRRLGAAIGCAGGPAAGYGAAWSQIGDGRVHVWLIATLLCALLGALCWRLFVPDPADLERPGAGFAALFGACVGLVGGAIAAFPVGAVVATPEGAVGGAAAVAAWRATQGQGALVQPLAAAFTGVGVALGVAMLVTG
jgi:hypothetical protein